MTDWKAAGRKADAHRIRDLWRQPFDNSTKRVVRDRVRDVLLAAGGTVCLDLGGGGQSAELLRDAGLRVISVEDGSLDLEDRGYPVSTLRKRRAHETIAGEGGYEARWGKAAKFAHEADVAYLDFCGPWSSEVRRTIRACQHMKAVVVTLMTDHDISTGSTDQRERLLAYIAWLKDSYRPKPSGRIAGQGQTFRATPCRLIAQYKRSGGQPVWVFLLSKKRVLIKPLTTMERERLHPEQRVAQRRQQTERWASDEEWREQKKTRQYAWLKQQRADPAYREREKAKQRERWAERYQNDPVFREAWRARAKVNYLTKKGRLGPASPA